MIKVPTVLARFVFTPRILSFYPGKLLPYLILSTATHPCFHSIVCWAHFVGDALEDIGLESAAMRYLTLREETTTVGSNGELIDVYDDDCTSVAWARCKVAHGETLGIMCYLNVIARDREQLPRQVRIAYVVARGRFRSQSVLSREAAGRSPSVRRADRARPSVMAPVLYVLGVGPRRQYYIHSRMKG